MTDSTWHASSDKSIPGDTDVHVWRARLDLPDSRLHDLGRYLCPDERERAGRFRFDRHRKRFVASHGILRHILGRYLEQGPAHVAFSTNAMGKPDFVSESNPPRIRFNMSHSGDLALYAVTLNRDVGIDVEQIRPNPDALQIARRYFSEPEYEMIRSTPEASRQRMFFRFWTLKEAGVKATGEGIGALENVRVTLNPETTDAVIKISGDVDPHAGWHARTLNPLPDYIGAFVTAGSPICVKRFLYSEVD